MNHVMLSVDAMFCNAWFYLATRLEQLCIPGVGSKAITIHCNHKLNLYRPTLRPKMPAKTRASTQDPQCTVTRSKIKMDSVSQPNIHLNKRKRASGDEGGFTLAPEEQQVAISDAIISLPRKKPTPHKAVAKSTDLKKELNKLRKA